MLLVPVSRIVVLATLGNLHLLEALSFHLCHNFFRQVIHASDLLIRREAIIFVLGGPLTHLLIQFVLGYV